MQLVHNDDIRLCRKAIDEEFAKYDKANLDKLLKELESDYLILIDPEFKPLERHISRCAIQQLLPAEFECEVSTKVVMVKPSLKFDDSGTNDTGSPERRLGKILKAVDYILTLEEALLPVYETIEKMYNKIANNLYTVYTKITAMIAAVMRFQATNQASKNGMPKTKGVTRLKKNGPTSMARNGKSASQRTMRIELPLHCAKPSA